jgi:IS30 family transposase
MKRETERLNLEERIKIQELLESEHSRFRISKIMCRAYATIQREIQRNSVNGKYDAVEADKLSKTIHRMRFRIFNLQEAELIKQMVERQAPISEIVRTIKCAKATLRNFLKATRLDKIHKPCSSPGILERLEALEEQMKIVFDALREK